MEKSLLNRKNNKGAAVKHQKRVNRWLTIGAALVALVCLVFLGLNLFGPQPSDKYQKDGYKTPDFSFQDRSGRMFSSAELKGKVWVADFIFTHCAGTCPLLTNQMMVLKKQWGNDPGFKLVSFTVDPDRDTVPVLKKYGEDCGSDPNQWFFLTWRKDELYKVIGEGFKLTAAPNEEGEKGFEFIHTTRMVLVDGNGMVRGFYDAESAEDLPKLHQDIVYLMGSRKKS